MIYFAQADISGQIKIGYHGGTDANDRLRELQTGCPTKLILLGTIPGGPETESDLHRQFSFAHAHGEWFRPVPELLTFIGAQSAGRELNGTKIESRFVQIKILTVGKKSFTQSLFRQLSERTFVNWHASTSESLSVRGLPWGWIRVIEKEPATYLIWQSDNSLFKWHFGPYPPVWEICRGIGLPQSRENREMMQARFDDVWAEAHYNWLEMDQLFIGV